MIKQLQYKCESGCIHAGSSNKQQNHHSKSAWVLMNCTILSSSAVTWAFLPTNFANALSIINKGFPPGSAIVTSRNFDQRKLLYQLLRSFSIMLKAAGIPRLKVGSSTHKTTSLISWQSRAILVPSLVYSCEAVVQDEVRYWCAYEFGTSSLLFW